MKFISLTIVLFLFSLSTFCQSPPPPPAGPGGSDLVTTETPVQLTQMLVFPMSFTNSQVNIVVQNPPSGTYILELVEPPSKVIKTKAVSNSSPVLYDLQNIDTDDVEPGNYVIRYFEGGHQIMQNVTIIAP